MSLAYVKNWQAQIIVNIDKVQKGRGTGDCRNIKSKQLVCFANRSRDTLFAITEEAQKPDGRMQDNVNCADQ